jgi:hypothetical protein
MKNGGRALCPRTPIVIYPLRACYTRVLESSVGTAKWYRILGESRFRVGEMTMRNILIGILLPVTATLFLAACGAHETRTTPTTSMTPTHTALSDATSRATRTAPAPSPTSPPAPTQMPADAITPGPTATPLSTEQSPIDVDPAAPSPSSETPTPTAASLVPEILSFQVVPREVQPGDTVTLTWEARGDQATLCPSARYVLFTSEDCQQVPVTGSTTFVIPQEAAGFQTISFLLQVETPARPDRATAEVSVLFRCDRAWFFSDVAQAGVCPQEPTRSSAAAQYFEHGTMIWLEQPGRYFILEDTQLHAGEDRKRLDVISDPLEIIRDTSSDFNPPPGRFAPQSGFGLVWRGDVTASPGYRQRLGWALEPEIGYQAAFQCDDARPSGGRSWQTCYLEGPDGSAFVLHPLGGWYVMD